jgi:hypothetical protein
MSSEKNDDDSIEKNENTNENVFEEELNNIELENDEIENNNENDLIPENNNNEQKKKKIHIKIFQKFLCYFDVRYSFIIINSLTTIISILMGIFFLIFYLINPVIKISETEIMFINPYDLIHTLIISSFCFISSCFCVIGTIGFIIKKKIFITIYFYYLIIGVAVTFNLMLIWMEGLIGGPFFCNQISKDYFWECSILVFFYELGHIIFPTLPIQIYFIIVVGVYNYID